VRRGTLNLVRGDAHRVASAACGWRKAWGFSAVNGLAYGDDHVIAFLDYKRDEWLYYDSGYHWPLMVVSKAPAPTATE